MFTGLNVPENLSLNIYVLTGTGKNIAIAFRYPVYSLVAR